MTDILIHFSGTPVAGCLAVSPGRRHKYRLLIISILFFALFPVVSPVSAAVWTLTTADNIAANITLASDGDTLILNPGTYNQNAINIGKNITIKANESAGGTFANTIIDAQSAGRIFNNNALCSLTIDNLTLTGGSTFQGGGINSNGILTATSCNFTGCTATGGSGGGIYSSGSDVTAIGCNFTDCTADTTGGGIWSSGDVTINSCIFTTCTADTTGGGIWSTGGSVTADDCTFTECRGSSGGGIYSSSAGSIDLTSCSFSLCTATPWSGGGIWSIGSSITAVSCSFSGCTANINGSGIWSTGGSIDLTSCSFSGCTAGNYGGGIWSTGGSVTADDCTFTDCDATTYSGGGIHSVNSGTLTATSCTFTNCDANAGWSGGGILSENDNLDLTSCIFNTCTAGSGGGIWSNGGSVTTDGCLFTGCNAGGRGGGIYFFTGGNITATSCIFSGCTADDGGGIDSSDDVNMDSCNFTGCTATSGSGGGLCSLNGGSITATSCNFTDCTATSGSGGGIYSSTGGSIDLTSGSFSGCTAGVRGGGICSNGGDADLTSCEFTSCTAGNNGGALYSSSSSIMHYCRIHDCNTGTAVVNNGGTVDAENNWWGINSSPSGFTGGGVDYDPWLVLSARASHSPIYTHMTSTITADLTINSDGTDTSGGGHLPDGIPVAFAITSGTGTLSAAAGNLVSGLSATTYSPATVGNAIITATVDDQPASASVRADAAPAGGGGGSSGGGSNTDTGVGFVGDLGAGQSASFDMSKGAVYRVVIIAGTDLDKMMITVIKEGSLPSSITLPDGEVYEFEDVTLYYVDNGDLSGGTLYFKVPKSWLASRDYDFGDIVLLHYNEETDVWEELVTTFTGEEGSYYYYSAETSSFSWFAIAYSEGATIIPEEIAAATPVPEKATVVQTATSSVSETEAAVSSPGNESSQPSPASLIIPGLAIILVAIIVVGLIIRRRSEKYPDWWDHGQK